MQGRVRYRLAASILAAALLCTIPGGDALARTRAKTGPHTTYKQWMRADLILLPGDNFSLRAKWNTPDSATSGLFLVMRINGIEVASHVMGDGDGGGDEYVELSQHVREPTSITLFVFIASDRYVHRPAIVLSSTGRIRRVPVPRSPRPSLHLLTPSLTLAGASVTRSMSFRSTGLTAFLLTARPNLPTPVAFSSGDPTSLIHLLLPDGSQKTARGEMVVAEGPGEYEWAVVGAQSWIMLASADVKL